MIYPDILFVNILTETDNLPQRESPLRYSGRINPVTMRPFQAWPQSTLQHKAIFAMWRRYRKVSFREEAGLNP
jgi:hypothetical protein